MPRARRAPSRRVAILFVAFSLFHIGLFGSVAGAAELPLGGTFQDDDGMMAEGYIEAIAAVGVTKGCGTPDSFCPHLTLTRGQMASFLVRAFDIAVSPINRFKDDNGSVHEPSINALAEAGITAGCTSDSFCPNDRVTKAQLASFLLRALELAPSSADAFPDDLDSLHDGAINALYAAGIVEGCTATSYCPWNSVPRWLLATNMARALGLDPIYPPYPPHADVGDGKRIIYDVGEQRVWLINEDNVVIASYLVSGRKGTPRTGDFAVFSKSELASAGHDGITMQWMVRFYCCIGPSSLPIGFHAIPRYARGTPMQTPDQLGTYQSGGCVRQEDTKAYALYQWAEIGTPVHVVH
jgi:hypothetical protein